MSFRSLSYWEQFSHGNTLTQWMSRWNCSMHRYVPVWIWGAWWCHQMETLSALLALCEGNPLITGGFTLKRPVMHSLMFSLICTSTNVWANKWNAGELRRHQDPYDVTVMGQLQEKIKTIFPGIGITIIKKRQSYDCLFFIMVILYLERWFLHWNRALGVCEPVSTR